MVFETISDFFKVGAEKLHTLQAQIMDLIEKVLLYQKKELNIKGDQFLKLIKEMMVLLNFNSSVASIRCDWIIKESQNKMNQAVP